MNTSENIKIIMADDQPICRKGFSSMFRDMPEVTLLAEAANGQELVRLVDYYKPDVILTDIRMPVMDGMTATSIIRKKHARTYVIAFTISEDYKSIIQMEQAGVSGYLLKDATADEILKAIRSVHRGETYYCTSTKAILSRFQKSTHYNPVTNEYNVLFNDTEKKIIYYICCQLAAKEIAATMKMNLRTLEGWRTRIMEKMNVINTAGLCVYAVKHGLYRDSSLPISNKH